MQFMDISSYFITVVALALAPGPVFVMLMARAASNDVKGAVSFAVGGALGGLTIISAVCFGLSAWFTEEPELFSYSKYLMIAYISWIASGIWRSGFDLNSKTKVKTQSVLSSIFAGFLTCMLSPYFMVLLPLSLPELLDISVIEMPDFLIAAVTTFLALIIGKALIIGFAAQLRRIARSEKASKVLNRSLAVVLVTVGEGMALS